MYGAMAQEINSFLDLHVKLVLKNRKYMDFRLIQLNYIALYFPNKILVSCAINLPF